MIIGAMSSPSATSPTESRLFGLDLFRSVAIGLVLLCHVLLTMRFAWKGIGGWSVMAGYLGVELFFVLSGFLIGGILIRDLERKGPSGGNLMNFWSRRWLRTLPNYFLFLAVNVLVFWSVNDRMPVWGNHAWFGQNLMQPANGFFPEAWSLSVEEWFYILAPFAIFVAARVGLSVRTAVLTVAVLGIVGVSGWRMIYVAQQDPSWMTETRPLVFVRLDACMFGVLAAFWRHAHAASWFAARWIKLSLGIASLVGVCWMFRTLPLDESFAARTHLFTLTSIGAMLCLPAVESLRAPGKRTAVAISCVSRWSYSLYLVNFLIFQWLAREAGLGLFETGTALVAAITGLFLSVVASAVVYHGFELPILKLRDRWTGHAKAEEKPVISAKPAKTVFPVSTGAV
jgi:peptidoglycan/LPS O-acetylase OafA/YrhL